jgi:hypothetical protein
VARAAHRVVFLSHPRGVELSTGGISIVCLLEGTRHWIALLTVGRRLLLHAPPLGHILLLELLLQLLFRYSLVPQSFPLPLIHSIPFTGPSVCSISSNDTVAVRPFEAAPLMGPTVPVPVTVPLPVRLCVPKFP